MKQQVLQIIKSKVFSWPVLFLSITIASVFAYYASIKELTIFPNKNSFSCNSYTDKANDGNSQIVELAISDSVIKFKFLLKEGFQSPYAGLTINPLVDKFINAKKFNRLNITIRGINIDRVGIAFFTPPIPYEGNNYQDEALYHSYLNITDQPVTYNLPIKQFQHPEWWQDLHHLPKSLKNKPDLSHILHLNIGSAFSTDIIKEKTLEIKSVTFTRNNQMLFLVLVLLYLGIILLYFAILYLVASRKDNITDITVKYKPLEISDPNINVEKCLEYINANYFNSQLSLEIIAKETAFTPRRITSIIHDRYQCNFKTYLNRLRITESKRFLSQTDLNIGEIAYKVGFNNQSHFNRVFKSELGISPSEYRDNQLD